MSRKPAILLMLLLMLLATVRCSVLNIRDFEVTSVSPSNMSVSNTGDLESVAVSFSSAPHRERVAAAFSLTKDRAPVSGRFTWAAAGFEFVPHEGIQPGHDYEIALSTTAQDLHGNSLVERVVHRFSTRSHTEPFEVVAVNPEDGGRLAARTDPITLRFSRAVDRSSLLENLSVRPAFDFYIEWDNDDRVARIVPREKIDTDRRYTVRIEDRLRDSAGNALAQRFESGFHAGVEAESPAVEKIQASYRTAPDSWDRESVDAPELELVTSDTPDGEIPAYAEWERFWSILVRFTRPVSIPDIERGFFTRPAVPFTVHTDSPKLYSGTVRIEFESPLEYGQRYVVGLAEPIHDIDGRPLADEYRAGFEVRGPASVPPRVTELAFLEDPATGELSPPLSDDDVLDLSFYAPYTEYEIGYFELVVEHAVDSQIGRYHFAENVDITVDNWAADIEIIDIVSHGPFEDNARSATRAATRFLVVVRVEDNPDRFGRIRIVVHDRLADGFGNRIERQWRRDLNNAGGGEL